MKVFISWSGKFSKECAELLRDWIKCTLQASEPWISSMDIDKGSLWFNDISDELKDTKIGIVCLTKENKDKPWILFESGALAKGIATNKVCTFLINLRSSDLDNPLAQFNHTIPDKEGMKALLTTINKELEEKMLEDRILDQVFDTYWGSFERDFNAIIQSEPQTESDTPARTNDQMLEEILYTTRTMDRRIRQLESKKDGDSTGGPIATRKELDERIEELIDGGLTPDDVVEALGESAPIRYTFHYATKLWDRIHRQDDDPEENS